MVNFIKNYEIITNERFIDDKEDLFRLEKITLNNFDLNSKQYKENVLKLEKYLNLIQEKCREKWSTFNTENCITGLILIFLSTFVVCILVTSLKTNPDFKLNFLSIFKRTFLFVLISNLVSYIIIGIFVKSYYALVILNLVTIIEFKPTMPRLKYRTQYFLYFLTLLIPFSNSFIIRENSTLRFILITVLCVEFISNCKSTNKDLFLKKLFYLISLILLLRLMQLFYVCREEVLVNNCTENIYFVTQLSKISFDDSNHDFQIYVLFMLSNFILITLIISYILKTNTIFKLDKIKILIYLQIIILFSYWTIQLFMNISKDSFNRINIYLARLFYAIFIILQFLIWKKQDKITNFVVSLGLLLTLISGQSSLSIWFLILALDLYARFHGKFSFLFYLE